MQNLASGGFAVPQLGQVTIAAESRPQVSARTDLSGRPYNPERIPTNERRRELHMHRARILAAVAVLGLLAAACNNNSSGGVYGAGGSSSTSTSSPAAMTAATVATAKVGDLGTVLVDGDGMTLYLFESDTGSTSTCTGTCASTWPALTTTGDPKATSGADSSMLGTTTRDDGSTQVTYDGHPLYLYSGDSAAGQANGQGIGNVWFAVTSQGTAANTSGGGGGGNGGGYGGGGYG
jgi:predicted lipoprotein with Yx(FWY)xxD motif